MYNLKSNIIALCCIIQYSPYINMLQMQVTLLLFFNNFAAVNEASLRRI